MNMFNVYLSLGSQGTEVKHAQKLLNYAPSCLPSLTVDGDFGSRTETRVKEFQRNSGVMADGCVGPQTMRKLAMSPAQLEGATRQIRTELARLGCSAKSLVAFDRNCSQIEDTFVPIGYAQALIPAAVIFILFCAAVIAVCPTNNKAGQDLARFVQEQLDALRKSLNLVPPALLVERAIKSIRQMCNEMVKRIQEEVEKCKKINPGGVATCAKLTMAYAVAVQNVANKLRLLTMPGYTVENLTKGIIVALAALVVATANLGQCMGCANIQFFS